MPPKSDAPEAELPAEFIRDDLPLPEVSERDLVTHYVRLSRKNYAVDLGFYPLGSCTMKYNPKINEAVARLPGIAHIHPLQPDYSAQGALAILYELQQMLAEISGFHAVTLQPAAGAQGELTGVLVMAAYLNAIGQSQRDIILVPDSAHGTNPATASMAGLRTVEIRSDKFGNTDIVSLRQALAKHEGRIAGLMITNPNTLGLFEQRIEEICALIHEAGGLVYGDGANMNAILGIVKPGDLGIDIMHFNLHKTFSTPHGGGGPGAGPVACVEKLAAYLPGPLAVLDPDDQYRLSMPEKSIGRVRSFWGNFGVLARAYTYIRMHGAEGLRRIAEDAVLNANYLMQRVKQAGSYPLPFGERICMHEFVCQGQINGAAIHALDISKRMIDYGYHPPTNYFPLIVPEALMIEPTETTSVESLDRFADVMEQIAQEACSEPHLLHEAPHTAPTRRLDEVRAARQMVLTDFADEGKLAGQVA
ncbi:MAG: aminomethyl-transferring glycine dehydrogenase subunit GcvPB [Caldilineaceae bacterium]|nr:aminomethyl-transferring glycine dehydrogenase subunit GcvPB [Caldilineaceae bacterium]